MLPISLIYSSTASSPAVQTGTLQQALTTQSNAANQKVPKLFQLAAGSVPIQRLPPRADTAARLKSRNASMLPWQRLLSLMKKTVFILSPEILASRSAHFSYTSTETNHFLEMVTRTLRHLFKPRW
jgi:hypothetical protein